MTPETIDIPLVSKAFCALGAKSAFSIKIRGIGGIPLNLANFNEFYWKLPILMKCGEFRSFPLKSLLFHWFLKHISPTFLTEFLKPRLFYEKISKLCYFHDFQLFDVTTQKIT